MFIQIVIKDLSNMVLFNVFFVNKKSITRNNYNN